MISVIVVTYNGSPWIQRCLTSLRNSSHKAHVIVVDNASTDTTAAIVEREHPGVELIRLTNNLGFGGGNNVGIARSIVRGSTYTFLLNQDAYVTESTLEELTYFMDGHPDIGVVSPLHCSPDEHCVDQKTYLGYLQTFARKYLCDAALGKTEPYYRVHGINAAAWFVRTSVFSAIGGFDPLFFMYGEDDDLLARFKQHDIAFALLPSSRIVHLRESPPSIATNTFWNDVQRRARRERSRLVVTIKDPLSGRFHMAIQIVANGILRPFADFLVERKTSDFLGNILASWHVFREIGTILAHARICSGLGAHFLPLSEKSTSNHE